MDNIKKFFEEIWKIQFINSLIIIVLSIILYKMITYFLEKGEEKNTFRLSNSKKGKTYFKLVKSIIRLPPPRRAAWRDR